MDELLAAAEAVISAYTDGDDGDGNDLTTCMGRLSNAVEACHLTD